MSNPQREEHSLLEELSSIHLPIKMVQINIIWMRTQPSINKLQVDLTDNHLNNTRNNA